MLSEIFHHGFSSLPSSGMNHASSCENCLPILSPLRVVFQARGDFPGIVLYGWRSRVKFLGSLTSKMVLIMT